MPCASSSSSSASPSQPGKEKWALPGSRSLGVAVEHRVRHRRAHPRRPARRAARRPRGELGLPLHRHLDRDRERGDPGHVQGAGAHVALLPAAVQQRRAGDVAAEQQRADAGRPAELVPGRRSARRHRWRRSPPAPDRPPGSRRCGTAPRARRPARPARRPAARVPTSLLAHIAVTSAISSPCSASSSRTASRSTRPCRVDRQPGHLRRPRLAEPATASSTAWCSTATASDPAARGRRRPAGPVDALDREVVALGAAAGEDHLGRSGAERRGDPLPRLLDVRRARRPGACRDDALPTLPAAATYASIASGSIGVVAA